VGAPTYLHLVHYLALKTLGQTSCSTPHNGCVALAGRVLAGPHAWAPYLHAISPSPTRMPSGVLTLLNPSTKKS